MYLSLINFGKTEPFDLATEQGVWTLVNNVAMSKVDPDMEDQNRTVGDWLDFDGHDDNSIAPGDLQQKQYSGVVDAFFDESFSVSTSSPGRRLQMQGWPSDELCAHNAKQT